MDSKEQPREEVEADSPTPDLDLVNASGHHQELERGFGLWHVIGLNISAGNDWIALGGSLVRRAP